MCGIAGISNYGRKEPVDTAVLSAMCRQLEHRGPDDAGLFEDPASGIGLAHRRLSIIDLSTGHQPMSNANGDMHIVFNGEIYNFAELKQELQGKRYRFRTKSDTEVILSLYEEYGPDAFGRLNGIFAFAIFDARKRQLVLARDHFGVKPLYYYDQSGRFLFGSEIKAILQDPSVSRTLDFEALNSFLTFRYNPSPQTLFEGIRKLEPGHFLVVTEKGIAEHRSHWSYRPKTNAEIREVDAIAEYQRLLARAVDRQMLSDVPVGLLLSGGVDSAIIGTLMRQSSGERFRTFTVGFPGTGDYNELRDARATATLIDSEHSEITISQEEYIDFFLRSFHFSEEPIAEPTIPALYYVSKLAAEHVKVVLTGQGADEPLAGYTRYLGESVLGSYGAALRMLPLAIVAKMFPRSENIRRTAFAARSGVERERFLGIHTIFTPEQKSLLFNDATAARVRNVDQQLIDRLYDNATDLLDSLSRLLYVDSRMSLSDNLLLFGDKMSMANSLEMRVPFLDIDLVSFLESLPAGLKLRRLKGKYIHKKAASKWLPAETIYRKKRGFVTPIDEWLRSGLDETVRSIVSSEHSASRKYFNLPFIHSMIDSHRHGKEDLQRHIFALLSFELWYQTFFENRTSDIHVTNHAH